MAKNHPIDVRLLLKLEEVESGCWEWRGRQSTHGYGMIGDEGRDRLAHRVAYEIFVGPILEGAVIMHSCDNRLCCNPAHLTAATTAANNADCVAKGRTKPPTGERNGSAKVSAEQALSIYRDRRLYREIAADYGLSVAGVCAIKKGKAWAHLTGHAPFSRRSGNKSPRGPRSGARADASLDR